VHNKRLFKREKLSQLIAVISLPKNNSVLKGICELPFMVKTGRPKCSGFASGIGGKGEAREPLSIHGLAGDER
jgi:hypothetical protein